VGEELATGNVAPAGDGPAGSPLHIFGAAAPVDAPTSGPGS
jgi:hypothetical protein